MSASALRRSPAVGLVAAMALAGCGTDDGEEATLERLRKPGCVAQARASFFAPAGLRAIRPRGTTADALASSIRAYSAGFPEDQKAQVREFVHVLSLGDGDTTGEAGEEFDPKDREDAGVLLAPPVPADHGDVLDLAVRQFEQEARRSVAGSDVRIRLTSKVTGDVARVTGTYGAGKDVVRERYAAAFTSCAFVKVIGWPTQVERILARVQTAKP